MKWSLASEGAVQWRRPSSLPKQDPGTFMTGMAALVSCSIQALRCSERRAP